MRNANSKLQSTISFLLACVGMALAGHGSPWPGSNEAHAEATAGCPPITNLDDFVLFANEATDLSDRASATGNVGSNATVQVGADGRVIGSVQARSGVTLRARARVEGNVTSGGSVVRQPGTVVTGVVTTNASVPIISIPTQTVNPGAADVILYRGQSQVLAPGAYDEVHVFAGASLTLRSGAYAVRRFVVEAGASALRLDVASGNITLGVREQFWLGDSITMSFVGTGSPSQVRIYSHQTSMLRIGTDSTFIGNVTAPFAEVSVASRTTVRGFIHARRATVDPDSRLTAQ